MHNSINLKSEPTIAVVREFACPFQTAGRRADEFLSKFYKAMLRYSDHMAGIRATLGGVNVRDEVFGSQRD